jgi:hypothetical protein
MQETALRGGESFTFKGIFSESPDKKLIFRSGNNMDGLVPWEYSLWRPKEMWPQKTGKYWRLIVVQQARKTTTNSKKRKQSTVTSTLAVPPTSAIDADEVLYSHPQRNYATVKNALDDMIDPTKGDIAYWWPKENPEETFQIGEVVAIKGAKATKVTVSASALLVVPRNPWRECKRPDGINEFIID